MNLVLRCIDFLRECITRLRASDQPGSAAPLLEELAALDDRPAHDTPPPTSPAEPVAPVPAPVLRDDEYHLTVHFEAGLQLADLKARLEANPDDHQARYDLALALLAGKDREGAVETLLELFRRDAEWNDGAAKAQLFKLFDSFGPKDPLT
ncbi:MAG: tetratricopeptide repeat protein, partial [Gemmatimonadetes bacterium]|nr:tetratricopeptide repeat protein [Gemmatimonadota bacterium]